MNNVASTPHISPPCSFLPHLHIAVVPPAGAHSSTSTSCQLPGPAPNSCSSPTQPALHNHLLEGGEGDQAAGVVGGAGHHGVQSWVRLVAGKLKQTIINYCSDWSTLKLNTKIRLNPHKLLDL